MFTGIAELRGHKSEATRGHRDHEASEENKIHKRWGEKSS